MKSKVESGYDIEYSFSNSRDDIIHSFTKNTNFYSINNYNKQYKDDGKSNYSSLVYPFLI